MIDNIIQSAFIAWPAPLHTMPLVSFCEIITLKNLRFFREEHLMDKITHKVRCEQWANIIKE